MDSGEGRDGESRSLTADRQRRATGFGMTAWEWCWASGEWRVTSGPRLDLGFSRRRKSRAASRAKSHAGDTRASATGAETPALSGRVMSGGRNSVRWSDMRWRRRSIRGWRLCNRSRWRRSRARGAGWGESCRSRARGSDDARRGDDAQQPRQVGAKTEGCLNRRGHGATVLAGDRIKFVEGGSNREPSDDKAEERRRVNKPRKPVADEGHGERCQKANDDQHTQNAVACISADFHAAALSLAESQRPPESQTRLHGSERGDRDARQLKPADPTQNRRDKWHQPQRRENPRDCRRKIQIDSAPRLLRRARRRRRLIILRRRRSGSILRRSGLSGAHWLAAPGTESATLLNLRTASRAECHRRSPRQQRGPTEGVKANKYRRSRASAMPMNGDRFPRCAHRDAAAGGAVFDLRATRRATRAAA